METKKNKLRSFSLFRGFVLVSVAVACAIALLMVRLATPVAAYDTTTETSSKAYKTGYFYLTIADEGGVTSKVKISFSSDTAPSFSNLKSGNSHTWNVSLSTASGSKNNHNISLASSTMKSQVGTTGSATIAQVKIKYTQHKYYKYTGYTAEKPAGGRFSACEIASDGDVGESTIVTGVVDTNTVREIKITLYMANCGLVTHNNVRYRGTEFVLNYGKPAYTAKFKGNGNTGGTMNDQSVLCGNQYDLTNKFTRTGYNFSYWTDKDGTKYNDKETCTALGNMTFTAHWSAYKHTVSYDANGGSGVPAEQTKTYGSSLTLSGTKPTKTGYMFSYWKGDNGYNYNPGTEYTYDKNGGTVILTAQWIANKYTVSYNANGGSGTMDSNIVTFDSSYTTKDSAFAKTGYKFTGWNEKPDGTGTDWTSWIGKPWTWTYTKDITLYAQWKAATYTVRYDANGGTGSMSDQTLYYDTGCNLATNTFKRPSYTFLGWSTDNDAAVQTYTNGQSVKNITEPAQTVTLYAVWKKTDASFDLETIVRDDNMFIGDGKLKGGAGTAYDKNNVDSKYAHVDNAGNPGYFTRR